MHARAIRPRTSTEGSPPRGAERAPAPNEAPRAAEPPRGAEASADAITAAHVQAHLGAGQPLDPGTRARMERGLGDSLGGVRVHTDAAAQGLADRFGAPAFTVGQDVGFARGAFRPGTLEGDAILAHELAHTLQQRGGEGAGGRARDADEGEADRAAMAALLGQPRPGIQGGGGRALRLFGCKRNTGEAARQAEALLPGDAQTAAFALLRRRPADQRGLTQDVDAALIAIFGAEAPQNHALWLARTLARRGPEQEWVMSWRNPSSMVKVFHEYADRLRQGWQPGAFDLFMPDVTDDERKAFSVQAHFFPGRRPDLRALVVGGIHGSEPQGAEIAERLRARLQQDCAAGNPPLYTTIVVPVLFRRTHLAPVMEQSGQRLQRGQRYVGIKTPAFPEGIEPNRNFPLEIESYADARRRVALRLPELLDPKHHTRAASGTHVTSRILPENRALIRLIEQFRPQRLITLHAHSVLEDNSAPKDRVQSPGRGRGDLPGIFVDPRGGFNEATDKAQTPKGRADDQLAYRLLKKTRAEATGTWPTDPFQGNVATTWPTDIVGGAPYAPQAGTPTVHYTSTAHERGTSLGMWASAHNITTLTIEVPQWSTRAEREPLDRLMNVYRDALMTEVLNRE